MRVVRRLLAVAGKVLLVQTERLQQVKTEKGRASTTWIRRWHGGSSARLRRKRSRSRSGVRRPRSARPQFHPPPLSLSDQSTAKLSRSGIFKYILYHGDMVTTYKKRVGLPVKDLESHIHLSRTSLAPVGCCRTVAENTAIAGVILQRESASQALPRDIHTDEKPHVLRHDHAGVARGCC